MHESKEFKSKKQLISEIINCGKSPSYFIKKYVKIQHPLRGLIPFATFQYQDDLLSAFVKNRFNIVLKARQVGITSLMGAFIAWFILFHKDKNVLVVSTKQETAKNVIRAVKVAFANLPKWLSIAKVSTNNKQSVELDNGSRVKATTTASDVGRSEALSLLIIDECVSGDTKIKIRNKKTHEIREICIKDLYICDIYK
ncbi:MAG: terminase family protein [Nanoarchaeota archaeon]